MSVDSSMILFIIKLVLGAVAAFFAILLWAKTRDLAWMMIVVGTIFQYCAIVYGLLCTVGVIPYNFCLVFDIPLFTLVFTVVTPAFFIAAFIIIILRNKKYEG